MLMVFIIIYLFCRLNSPQTMSDQEKQSIPECATCKSANNVIRIVYGRPGAQLAEQAQQGHVKLGGCCVSDDMKHFHCKSCDIDF